MKKLILPLILVCLSFIIGRTTAPKAETRTTDTTYIYRTTYVDRPVEKDSWTDGFVPVPKLLFLTDTLSTTMILRDTIYLPREVKYYEEEDGRLRMWVSGYSPALDRYELDEKTRLIERTVTEQTSRWSLALSGGYGISQDGLSPYLGFGLSYDLVRFPYNRRRKVKNTELNATISNHQM